MWDSIVLQETVGEEVIVIGVFYGKLSCILFYSVLLCFLE